MNEQDLIISQTTRQDKDFHSKEWGMCFYTVLTTWFRTTCLEEKQIDIWWIQYPLGIPAENETTFLEIRQHNLGRETGVEEQTQGGYMLVRCCRSQDKYLVTEPYLGHCLEDQMKTKKHKVSTIRIICFVCPVTLNFQFSPFKPRAECSFSK